MELYNLPHEVLLNIFTTLSTREVSQLLTTSRYMYELCSDEYLWKGLIYDKFGFIRKVSPNENWRQNNKLIESLFSSEQWQIISMLKRLSLKHFELLKTLHLYTSFEYKHTNVPLECVYVRLNHYIESDTYEFYVSSLNRPTVWTPNGDYLLYTLCIDNTSLKAQQDLSYTLEEPNQILMQKGHKLHKYYRGDDHLITFNTIVLNRRQLFVLQSMF